jgi:glycosyltransferase involved in cell wall biosynthesis
MSSTTDTPALVLCVVDRPDWAHDRKTDALARALAGKYRIVKRFQAEVTSDEIEAADLVLLYYWLQVERMPGLAPTLRRHRRKLLIGICSHRELEGSWREPGIALLTELPRAVFANNLRLVNSFEKTLGRPVFYTPNGVDAGFFRPSTVLRSATASLRVGWAGSLTNHGTNHRGVHDVISPAVRRVHGAELFLAAREDRWRGIGKMRDFYHSLDVYVCASRSEGTPNPCLEAAACGLPIVTTRVGNMPELIRDGENGFFIERSVESLCARLALLRDDPEMRLRMAAASRAAVEAWDWRHQSLAYDAMLREVIGDKATVRQAQPSLPTDLRHLGCSETV